MTEQPIQATERSRHWARDAHTPSPGERRLLLVFWVIVVAGAAVLGSMFRPDEWYRQLLKPQWNPPDAVFARVWSLLYLLMALSAWLIAIDSNISARGRRNALTLFAFQLALNALWTPLFFYWHQPALAFIDLCALWLAIIATIWSFASIRTAAALLQVPYLIWVSFALVLNGAIWLMNR